MENNTSRVEKRYFDNVSFNNALIINALANVALKNGALIEKPKYYTYEIVRRNALARVDDITGTVNQLKTFYGDKLSDKQKEYIKKLENELNKINSLRLCDPIKLDYNSQVNFIYNGVYYSFWLPDNPFFETYYQKYRFVGFDVKQSIDFYAQEFCIGRIFKACDFDIYDYYTTENNAETVATMIFDELTNCCLFSEKYSGNRTTKHAKSDFRGNDEN